MEKKSINGVSFRYLHLGQHQVRIPLGHLAKDLREAIHKATSSSSYTTGKTTLEKNGDLICRAVPTEKMKFQELLDKVFNLMAAKINRYKKKTGNVKAQASTKSRHKSRNKRGRHHQRGALPA